MKESLKKVKVSIVVQSSEQLAGSGCAAVQVAISACRWAVRGV